MARARDMFRARLGLDTRMPALVLLISCRRGMSPGEERKGLWDQERRLLYYSVRLITVIKSVMSVVRVALNRRRFRILMTSPGVLYFCTTVKLRQCHGTVKKPRIGTTHWTGPQQPSIKAIVTT